MPFSFTTAQEENARVYSAITHLQQGVLSQQKLLERSRRAGGDADRGPSPGDSPERLQLQKQREELQSKIATAREEDASVLQHQLNSIARRLEKLEIDGKFAQTIIQSYEPSVCLIYVAIAFRDRTTGLNLHYAGLTTSGEPVADENKNPLLSLTGKGPEVKLDAFGAGFLVSEDGQILANRHVAEPWWQNDESQSS